MTVSVICCSGTVKCRELVAKGARHRGRKAWRNWVEVDTGRLILMREDALCRSVWRGAFLGTVQPVLARKQGRKT